MKAIGLLHDRTQRTRIVRKVIFSLSIGTLAYLITNLLTDERDVPQLLGVTLSVFIGGVTLAVQFLAEFDSRLGGLEESLVDRLTQAEARQVQHAKVIEDQVQSGFRKINDATELFGLVEASALQSDKLIQLVRHSTQIEPDQPDLVFRFARAEISRMAQFLKELSQGNNVSYEGEDRDWMLALARCVESSIDATSLTTVDAGGRSFVDGGLWASDLGQRYLEAQRDAIERGVRIRRVFIMDRANLASDKDFLNACSNQRDMGINVKILDSSSIPMMRRSSLFDFVLFDETISYEVTPTTPIEGTRPGFVKTIVELRRGLVRDRITRFRELWASARDLQ